HRSVRGNYFRSALRGQIVDLTHAHGDGGVGKRERSPFLFDFQCRFPGDGIFIQCAENYASFSLQQVIAHTPGCLSSLGINLTIVRKRWLPVPFQSISCKKINIFNNPKRSQVAMERSIIFFDLWDTIMRSCAYVALATSIALIVYYEVKVSRIKDLKEKYDYINLHEIKYFWSAIVMLIVATGLFVNSIGTITIGYNSMLWFYVRIFATVSLSI